ncbi:MAG TPA: DUF4231 domain-containing protein [Caulobacteraceae bacterium]
MNGKPAASDRRPTRATPPKAAIAFRVGVVGHRPDRLPSDEAGLMEVRTRVAEVLEAVSVAVHRFAAGPDGSLYKAGAGPTLTANSPLAEGADRIFAEEALRLGWRLTCVMPFARETFEHDFEGPESYEDRSLERFGAILDLAQSRGALTRFELNGHRERAREAYEAAGRVVLNQSDLLVVIWDGGAAAGTGGTVDTLREAISFNVPTLWIDTRAPRGWKVMRSTEDLDCLGEGGPCEPSPLQDPAELTRSIEELVSAELGLPVIDDLSPEVNAGPSHLRDYLHETRPRFNNAPYWKMFRDFMDVGRVRPPAIRVADFESQIRAAWPVVGDPGLSASAPPPAASWINAQLRAHYAWSDKLADLFADAHRSGFVTASLLAASAVFAAIIPVAAQFGRQAAIVTAFVEVIILVLMVGMPILARRRRWHQKWLEYRVLAELVRELRILVPLGGARPPPRTAAHLAAYGDPAQSWMNWQARAIGRAVGLPDARVTASYISSRIDELLDFVGTATPPHGQIGFHRINCERMERIHSRLHRMTLILFAVTIGTVAINWFERMLLATEIGRLTGWMVLLSAFLPALGAAFASINNHGEFARLQRRSRAMEESLQAVRDSIKALAAEPEPPQLARVTEHAAQIANMMVEENTEWRIVVLEVPHAAG